MIMVEQQQLERAIVTTDDRERLGAMEQSLRRSLSVSGGPYGGYLRMLRERLESASLVPPHEVGRDVVTMNSTVLARDVETGRRQTLTLVYTDPGPFGGNVSILTPLGAALLGARVGDELEWPTRRGPRRLRIERIMFQPEAAGEFDL